MVQHSIRAASSLIALAAMLATPAPAAAQSSAKKGTVEKITVHGEALVGNLSGESPDRTVFVYLPPSYATERNLATLSPISCTVMD